MIPVISPFPQYFDLDGSPLDAGYIFYGAPNQNPETSPVVVYWDAAGTQPAAQPIRTLNGFPVRSGSPAQVFTLVDYSYSVKNRRGTLVVYAPNSFASALSAGTGGFVGVQVFSTPGSFTYTPTIGVTRAIVELIGGGGAGGGAQTTAGGEASCGGGGASGVMIRSLINIIGTVSGSVGAGGTGASGAAGNAGENSVLGSLSAPGGRGGAVVSSTSSPASAGLAGSAPSYTPGNLPAMAGSSSSPGLSLGSGVAIGGNGANSLYGSGGGASGASSAGASASGSGGGGGGACNLASQGSARVGGAGASGVVVVYEFA